jgi:electron transport complex protein RnfB
MFSQTLTAVLIVTGIALAAGLLLSLADKRLPADPKSIVESINRLLPQTQCAQCGFPGCRPYAEAIVEAGVAINLCPPGGDETVQRLAEMLGRSPEPVATAASQVASVALIDEASCIGCTHCRTACPVDAITGAHQYMHTVIVSECTGCELCVAPCPVNCIRMVPAA